MPFFPACEYAPDNANLNAAYSEYILNVFPDSEGYIPCKIPVKITTGQPDVHTIYCHEFLDGEIAIFGGAVEKIYRWYYHVAEQNDGNGWVDVSRKDKPYHCTHEMGWSFVSFMNIPICANIGDKPQIWDKKEQRFRDVKNTFNEDENLKDERGVAYKASPVPYTGKLAVAGDFLMMCGTSQYPNRIVWSGIRNPEFWENGSQTSSFHDFTEGGECLGVQSATSPFVFCRNAIYQLNRTPTDSGFSIQKIYASRGLAVKGSLVDADGAVFFIDEDGFHSLSGSAGLQNIGFQKVDRTYSKIIDTRRAISRVSTLADTKNGRIYWNVMQKAEEDENSDEIGEEEGFTICYDYRLQKWTRLSFFGRSIAAIPLKAEDLDTMDKFTGPNGIDGLRYSLDSDMWKVEQGTVCYVNSSGEIESLIGYNAEASVEGADTGDTANQMVRVNNVYPVVDVEEFPCLAKIGYKVKDGYSRSETTWTREYEQSTIDGGFRFLVRGKSARVRIRIPEKTEWSKFQGFDAQFARIEAGKR